MKCLILVVVLAVCGLGVTEFGAEQPLGVAWREEQSKAPCNPLNGLCVGGGTLDESFEKAISLNPKTEELPLRPPVDESIPPAPFIEDEKISSIDAPSLPSTSEKEDPKDSESLPAPWAVTYAPYTSRGACKKPSQMERDIKRIASKGFSSIRLHSPDCSVLYFIGPIAAKHDISLILGIYVPAPPAVSDSSAHAIEPAESQVRAQVKDIITWAQGDYSQVEMVVVGDEAVFNDFITGEDLAIIISRTRLQLRSTGYMGAVSTTEPIMTLVENAQALCPVLDVVAANVQPYFSDHVSAQNAGSFLRDELIALSYVCSSSEEEEPMEIYSMETGWPKEGARNGKAVAGVEEQMAAVRSILTQGEDVVRRTVLGSWEDEAWREEGEWGVEQSWGVEGVF